MGHLRGSFSYFGVRTVMMFEKAELPVALNARTL